MSAIQQFWPYFLQQLVNGVTLGAIYGLIAIGYTMVYGIIGMINFAHGEIFMIGAFCAIIGFTLMGLLGITAVPLAILLVRRSFRLAPLISAIGVSIFLQNFVQLVQGAQPKALAPLVPGGLVLMTRADGFTAGISYLQILIILLTIALMAGFSLLISRTALGRAQRACAQDQVMAGLLGVDVNRTISITFVLGAGLAAVAGVMVALQYGVVDFHIGFVAGIKAFTAAVLGGIGSLPGAVLGGLTIGLVEALWSGYFSIEYKDVAAFVILILVLIIRPSGLLGRPEIEKV